MMFLFYRQYRKKRRRRKIHGMNIVAGEIARSVEFGRSAMNPAETITDLERIALTFSNDYKALLNEGYEDEE